MIEDIEKITTLPFSLGGGGGGRGRDPESFVRRANHNKPMINCQHCYSLQVYHEYHLNFCGWPHKNM